MCVDPDPSATKNDEDFARFVQAALPRLRRALVARYGIVTGTEAHADAVAYAWEHRARLASMANPVGYLYRVGQTSVRSQRRPRVVLPPEDEHEIARSEPRLHEVLARLSEDQRSAVLLVHAHGWTYADAADVLGIPVSTLRNHVHRGMKRLRRSLGEGS